MMRKHWYGLAVLLFGSSLVIADDLNYWDVPASEALPVATQITGGLTPKRPAAMTVVRAQSTVNPVQQVSAQEAPPAPTLNDTLLVAAAPKPAQNVPSDNAAVFAELQRLTDEVEKIKKDTKKPDTKKAWSSPKVGGRIFYDSYTIDNDGTNIKNKAGIREMRLSVAGTGFDSFDYKTEWGMTGATDTTNTKGEINLYDTWLGVKHVPLFGYLRAGHYRIETGMGYMVSGLHTTLTENASPASAFSVGRKLGLSSQHLFANDRIRFIYGLYDGTAINALRVSQNKDDHGQVFNTRLSAAPYYGDEGRYVLHFGGHYTYLADANSAISVQPGGSNWLSATLATDTVATNHHHRSGIEAAYQDGPFAIHSEAFFAQFGGNVDKTAKGFSTEFTYFLGGEHRAYSLTSGTFGAVKMKNNFHPFESGGRNLVDGFGAWQLVLQYGYTDLGDWRTDTRDSGNRGGLQSDVTFGVNWFWTPNVRWIFEYTNSQQNTGTDYVHTNQDIFGTSLRIFF